MSALPAGSCSAPTRRLQQRSTQAQAHQNPFTAPVHMATAHTPTGIGAQLKPFGSIMTAKEFRDQRNARVAAALQQPTSTLQSTTGADKTKPQTSGTVGGVHRVGANLPTSHCLVSALGKAKAGFATQQVNANAVVTLPMQDVQPAATKGRQRSLLQDMDETSPSSPSTPSGSLGAESQPTPDTVLAHGTPQTNCTAASGEVPAAELATSPVSVAASSADLARSMGLVSPITNRLQFNSPRTQHVAQMRLARARTAPNPTLKHEPVRAPASSFKRWFLWLPCCSRRRKEN